MTIKAHANAIAAVVGIDPLVVLAFMELLIPLLVACMREQSPEEVAEHFRQDTVRTRGQIRRACNRAWKRDHAVHTPKELVREVQHRMATATNAQYQAVYNSAACTS